MSPLVDATIDLLKKKAAEEVIKLLIAKMPFLGSWFFNPIIGWLVPIIIDVLYDKAALGINFLWITVENSAELNAAIKTRDELKAILQKGGDYKEANDDFNEATDDLIRRRHDRLPR